MTNPTPPTEQQLAEIDARAAYLDEYATLTDGPLQADADQVWGKDVPALLAEIRRLRAQQSATRALALLEAANFLRDASLRDPWLSVQEIGTALRNMADTADPRVGSLARDGFGLDEIAEMLASPVAESAPAAEQPAEACAKCRRPFDPTDTSFVGRARHNETPYCRDCVSRCHDSSDAFHLCVICREGATA
ncbi:hypothetical protein [Streptomyces griseorubiginosus]|uniref:hypothetical protein n=1 Tax=Streptomyces griseorubiginosus TaxID=67304 RepID=UPI0036E970EE